MRVFEIYNSAKRSRVAWARLFYNEAKGKMHIEILDGATPADLPLMLGIFAEQGKRTVPDKWARKWVAERIPPQGRQNLGEILRAHRLDAYDEIELLASSEGRSAQDDFLLREMPAAAYEYEVMDLDKASRSLCAIIGPQIAEKRKQAGMTQRDLAEKTGIDQAAISRIEAGKANPNIDTLDALAKGVGYNLLVRLV